MDIKNGMAYFSPEEQSATGYPEVIPADIVDATYMAGRLRLMEARIFSVQSGDDDEYTHRERAEVQSMMRDLERNRELIAAITDQVVSRVADQAANHLRSL